jgi:hypothetical protein
MWRNVAQCGAIAVWRSSAVRLSVAQCGSMWLKSAPHAHSVGGGVSPARGQEVATHKNPSAKQLPTHNPQRPDVKAPRPGAWHLAVEGCLALGLLSLATSHLLPRPRISLLHPQHSAPRTHHRPSSSLPPLPIQRHCPPKMCARNFPGRSAKSATACAIGAYGDGKSSQSGTIFALPRAALGRLPASSCASAFTAWPRPWGLCPILFGTIVACGEHRMARLTLRNRSGEP